MTPNEQIVLLKQIERYQIQIEELNSKVNLLREILNDLKSSTVTTNSLMAGPTVSWNTDKRNENYLRNDVKGFLIKPRPKTYPSGTKPFWDALENPPKEYSKDLTQVQLAVLALSICNAADKFELANQIIEIDPELNKESLINAFSGILSRMSKYGLINAEKSGLKNIYSLKR